jgi:precorrin-2/cobalt-factor-2 C20-methyltransferase
MSATGRFFGIGVGPGPAGYLPVAALEALREANIIYLPRAQQAEISVARQCLGGLDIDADRLREIEFTMALDRSVLRDYYAQIAERFAGELQAGHHVAYLTIGDSMTYSTYSYLLAALLDRLPDLHYKTFPGVTSYAAAAAAMNWPVGEGKERVLILPCPDEPELLTHDIQTHDVVVLMKIGKRLPWVLDLLRKLDIAQHCALATRIGLPGESLHNDLTRFGATEEAGYLATLLIRHTPRRRRHV